MTKLHAQSLRNQVNNTYLSKDDVDSLLRYDYPIKLLLEYISKKLPQNHPSISGYGQQIVESSIHLKTADKRLRGSEFVSCKREYLDAIDISLKLGDEFDLWEQS